VRGIGTLGSAETSLIDAVKVGKEAPPIEAAREPAPEIARRAAAISGLATVLLRVRSDDAGIASELVATRSELEDFARAAARGDESEHQLATGWRAELVGDELRRLLDGKIAVATSRRPPYVEIIERD
jgi:ribonuclease D